jgi:Na+/melibiose symporter-like transporter
MMQLCNSGAQMQSGKLYRSASYILMNDLQLSEEFWTPIGTNEYAFNGYFNFNNHKVTGIYTALFYDVVSYGGLFGVLTQNALIIESLESLWYVFLIAGVAVVVIVSVIISVVVSKKKKKRRHTLANK